MGEKTAMQSKAVKLIYVSSVMLSIVCVCVVVVVVGGEIPGRGLKE